MKNKGPSSRKAFSVSFFLMRYGSLWSSLMHSVINQALACDQSDTYWLVHNLLVRAPTHVHATLGITLSMNLCSVHRPKRNKLSKNSYLLALQMQTDQMIYWFFREIIFSFFISSVFKYLSGLYAGTFSAPTIWGKISFRTWGRHRSLYWWVSSKSWSACGNWFHWQCNQEGMSHLCSLLICNGEQLEDSSFLMVSPIKCRTKQ